MIISGQEYLSVIKKGAVLAQLHMKTLLFAITQYILLECLKFNGVHRKKIQIGILQNQK
jgi:hypothetical protein